MFSAFVNTLLVYFGKAGYAGIVFLMAIESSFIPFPSEVVIPPAAYLAQQGQMNIFLVVLSGITGSLIGAIFNYFLALKLGRTIVHSLARHKFAKFLLISEKKVIDAEEYFLKYGKISTFLGRLVPAVRQLISIPAGLARMDLKSFIAYTALGSGIWTTVLATLGYLFGSNRQLLTGIYHELKIVLLIIGIAVFSYFFIYKVYQKRRKAA